MVLRFRVFAAFAAASVLVCGPGFAAKLKFAPGTFQVYGGLGDGGGGKVSRGKLEAAFRHKTVDFTSELSPGSVMVRTDERRIYYVLPGNRAVMYQVGVGREGFTWSGTNQVTRKAEWPDWRPPREMIEREANRGRNIPEFVIGGPRNPLGARAIYIGDTEYRIHGTSEPWTIGQAVSSGCIRMVNEEVIDLYNRVEVGAVVVVE